MYSQNTLTLGKADSKLVSLKKGEKETLTRKWELLDKELEDVLTLSDFLVWHWENAVLLKGTELLHCFLSHQEVWIPSSSHSALGCLFLLSPCLARPTRISRICRTEDWKGLQRPSTQSPSHSKFGAFLLHRSRWMNTILSGYSQSRSGV